MRLVLDTNTVVSGLLWRGPPHRLPRTGNTTSVDFFVSELLLSELYDVLRRPKFAAQLGSRLLSAESAVETYAMMAILVAPAQVEPNISDDPDDDHVLAAAGGGRADLIVSGDRHLLDLGSLRGIRIVPPAVALDAMDARPPPFI